MQTTPSQTAFFAAAARAADGILDDHLAAPLLGDRADELLVSALAHARLGAR